MISEAKLRSAIPGLKGLTPAQVLAMEARAVAFFETMTARYFGPPEEVVEFVSGSGTHYLRLGDCAYLGDPEATLTVEERATPGATVTVLADEGYELRRTQRGAILARLDGEKWAYGSEYAVTYQRGYLRDAGPRDVEQFVIDLISLRVNFLDKAGMRSETIGGYSYTRFGEGDLDSIDGARELIAAWRQPVLA